ncbi:MAG TPA: hypothetical protein VG321_00035 [Solirubrobacteraceae bacterium]|nr:hypothetical protein [Solirubrobacteraceae bacterium]
MGRRVLCTVAFGVVAIAMLAGAGAAPPARAAGNGQSLCIGHHPQDFVWYTSSCTGHDEPEIDPLSTDPGSAQNLTWTLVLPKDESGTTEAQVGQVDAVGPTFWIGGSVTDPNSLFDQAFLELQFYPNSITTNCAAGGGYNVTYSADTYTACSPVWEVSKHGNAESAAFNAMLTDSATGGPLIMHAGDTITDHQYITAANDGMHITVTDLTTGHSGTIVLDSKTNGPLMPAFSVQKLGNALGWGLVNDAPNALVWEIGHTGSYTTPAGQYCIPGSATKPPCYSFDIPSWLTFSPLQIKGVTFGNGSTPKSWAAVTDTGGEAEVLGNSFVGPTTCSAYGGPFCSYPWYAWNGTLNAFTFGGDYPGTTNDYGKALQFAQTEDCTSPNGPYPQYCATVLK